MSFTFLPNHQIEDTLEKSVELSHKGYNARLMSSSKSDLIRSIAESRALIACNILTDFGVWSWGYAYARKKKVIVITGLSPHMSGKLQTWEEWLSSLNTQLTLFGDHNEPF